MIDKEAAVEKREKTAMTPDFDRFERLDLADIARIKSEAKVVMSFLGKQVFNQIPSVSAVTGLLVGAWVASNFTTSPIKGFLAEWGLMKGGTHVVSSGTYKFLSVLLPMIVTGVTAYAVHKGLKAFREMKLEVNMSRVSRLSPEVQAELKTKLTLIEKTREAGILSQGECETKVSGLYQSYARKRSSTKVEELIVSRLSGKLQ